MQWRVVIAIILLAAILTGGLMMRAQVEQVCRQASQPLERLAAQLKDGGPGDPSLLRQARTVWQGKLPFLSTLVEHQRLESVSERLAQAEGFLQMQDSVECIAQIEGCFIF